MADEKALIPFEEQRVSFLGEAVTLALANDRVYVPLRPFCNALGLSWRGQFARVKRHPILKHEVKKVRISLAVDNRHSVATCIPEEFFWGWIITLSPSRVKPEHAPKLLWLRETGYRAMGQMYFEDKLKLPFDIDSVELRAEIEPMSLNKQRLQLAVKNQCRRAISIGLPATLTVEQWERSIESFDGLCAYCEERSYAVIEHFIPLSSPTSPGTTIGNCVPSCFSCNTQKGNRHPDDVPNILRSVIDRVREKLQYLEEPLPF